MRAPVTGPAAKGSQPERQCIGCGRRGPQSGFLRLTMDLACDPPRVTVASAKEHRGRGAYLCRRRSCMDRALHRRAFQRAFRRTVVPDLDEIGAELETASGIEPEVNDTAGG